MHCVQVGGPFDLQGNIGQGPAGAAGMQQQMMNPSQQQQQQAFAARQQQLMGNI